MNTKLTRRDRVGQAFDLDTVSQNDFGAGVIIFGKDDTGAVNQLNVLVDVHFLQALWDLFLRSMKLI